MQGVYPAVVLILVHQAQSLGEHVFAFTSPENAPVSKPQTSMEGVFVSLSTVSSV